MTHTGRTMLWLPVPLLALVPPPHQKPKNQKNKKSLGKRCGAFSYTTNKYHERWNTVPYSENRGKMQEKTLVRKSTVNPLQPRVVDRKWREEFIIPMANEVENNVYVKSLELN